MEELVSHTFRVLAAEKLLYRVFQGSYHTSGVGTTVKVRICSNSCHTLNQNACICRGGGVIVIG